MPYREHDSDNEQTGARVNPEYAAFQLARALTTAQEHGDSATRRRAEEKIAKWATVLRSILDGTIKYGSRTPLNEIPGWATLDVVTGGFATGRLLAGGPVQDHEKKLLERQPRQAQEGRGALNAYYLSDEGFSELLERLRTGCYEVTVPEEGALMVVAWLAKHGNAEDARALLEQISPFFSDLRFYPVPIDKPHRGGASVHIQDVGQTIASLRRIKPNKSILAQKESVEIWAPYHDRVVALFLKTLRDDSPCENYPVGWRESALALLSEYSELRKKHQLCGKPEKPSGHAAQLRKFLGKCVKDQESLTNRELGSIRCILQRYVDKRGVPESVNCIEARSRQLKDVDGPAHYDIAGVVVSRLEKHEKTEGLDDIAHLKCAVSEQESQQSGVPEDALIPDSIERKIERCLNDTAEELVKRGVITSGETLARVLPQITSALQTSRIPDPALQKLYAAVYRAFRRRRSLLLLDLEKQIQIHELPWISAINKFRVESLSSRELAKKSLEEIATLTISTFPQVILPNKLLQELLALIKEADLNIPLVEEVAADIFMGQFSGKFLESAKVAANLLIGKLYANYYGIDYQDVLRIPTIEEKQSRFRQGNTDEFAQICISRAGVSFGHWNVAANGMIIEQQQILTTQNLAALFVGLDLTHRLRGKLDEMARKCFQWICKRQQVKVEPGHTQLIVLKNTAYAWRQMVFFLSLLPEPEIGGFLTWAEEHLMQQSESFRSRFQPALNGLMIAAQGRAIEDVTPGSPPTRRFLGWSQSRHWLLPSPSDR